jgi:hypothetical protein
MVRDSNSRMHYAKNLYRKMAETAKVQRAILLIGATGQIRTASFQNVEHLVVPTVALVEGVIHPVNAEHPELVLLEELAIAPQGWNGRPVVYGHPEVQGQPVSANYPEILESWSFGQVFNASLNTASKTLNMEAWINPARATAIGAQELITRLQNGKTIEISVGVFVSDETKTGTYNGKKYGGIWREIVPDHLAYLPDGYIGACSNDMGCGAPRAAVAHLVTNRGFVSLARTEVNAVADEKKTEEKKELAKPRSLFKRMRDFFKTAEGETDVELRAMLSDALYAIEPGSPWIDSVVPDEKLVTYSVMPEGVEIWYQRSYEIADGVVTFSAEKTQVTPKKVFEPVGASAPQPATAGTCGCGAKHAAEHKDAKEEIDMTKAERIKTLMDGKKLPAAFASEAFLNVCSDAQLTMLEAEAAKAEAPKAEVKTETPVVAAKTETPVVAAKVDAPKVQTEEEYLATAPQSIRDLVSQEKARNEAERASIVANMKTAQKVYTEEEMRAMPLPELRKMAKLCSVPTVAVDYSARGVPRDESVGDDSKVPPPPNMNERLKAAAAKRNGAATH